MATKKSKEPPMVRLEFPKKSGVEPKGFDKVTIDGKVRIVLEGTVKAIRKDEYEWDDGKNLSVRLSKCNIEPMGIPANNADALYPKMKANKG